MPDNVNQSSKTTRRRGRPQKTGTAKSDFLYFDAFELYQTKLAEFAGEKTTRRASSLDDDRDPRESPSERALNYVLQWMGKELGNISRGRLRNIFSVFRDVHDEPPDRPVEQEEAQAAWEARQSANFRECNEPPDGVQPDGKPEEDA